MRHSSARDAGLLPTASCIIIVLHDTARRTVNNNDNNTDNSVRCRRGDIGALLKVGLFSAGVFFADSAINYATVLCRRHVCPAGRVSARHEIIRAVVRKGLPVFCAGPATAATAARSTLAFRPLSARVSPTRADRNHSRFRQTDENARIAVGMSPGRPNVVANDSVSKNIRKQIRIVNK